MNYMIKGASLTIGILLSAFILGIEWDWVVKFGTDKWEDLIVTTIGTLLGFGTAILLYLREVADTKKSEHIAQLQRHVEHVRWFSGILEQVVRYANQQAEQLDLFVKRIKQEPSEIHKLAMVVSRSTDRMMSANNEATYHAYNTVFAYQPNLKNEYLNFIAVTDFAAVVTAKVKKDYANYLKGNYRRQLELKKTLEDGANMLSSMKLSMDKGGANGHLCGSELHISLNALLVDYSIRLIPLGCPMREIVETFIQPLKVLLLAHRHQPGTNELLAQLKNATILFTDIKNDSLSFLTSFAPDELRKPARRLHEIREAMEKGIKQFEADIRDNTELLSKKGNV